MGAETCAVAKFRARPRAEVGQRFALSASAYCFGIRSDAWQRRDLHAMMHRPNALAIKTADGRHPASEKPWALRNSRLSLDAAAGYRDIRAMNGAGSRVSTTIFPTGGKRGVRAR
jgi:hypothetical protein